jgi:hypothetical protein
VSTRTKILLVVAALAVLVIALSRGGKPTPEVVSLEGDRMAAYVPPGGTLVDTDRQTGGSVLGTPVSASYTRLFELARADAARSLAETEAAARKAGWRTIQASNGHGFSAEKRVGTGRLALAVVLVKDGRLLPDGVDPPALSVNLRRLAA